VLGTYYLLTSKHYAESNTAFGNKQIKEFITTSVATNTFNEMRL
jgi:hypothetical protein